MIASDAGLIGHAARDTRKKARKLTRYARLLTKQRAEEPTEWCRARFFIASELIASGVVSPGSVRRRVLARGRRSHTLSYEHTNAGGVRHGG